jgi:signal transduction histidine kinase
MRSAPQSTGAISLRRRVYLLMAVGSFLPLLLMGTAGVVWMRALDARLLVGRVSAAGAVAAHLDIELTDDLESLQRLAGQVASGLSAGDAAPVKRALRDAHPQFRHRDVMFVLDADRQVVAEEPPGALPRAAIPLVDEVLASGRPRLSAAVPGARGPVIYELVPIRGWSGQVVGVAGASFRAERRDFERMLRFLQRGRTGIADLVDDAGAIIASTARDRVGRPVECARRMVQLAHEKKALAVRCADCHAEYGVQLRPSEHLTFAAVGSAPWGVVVRQAASEALPTEGALPWYVVVIAVGGQLAVAAAFAWGAARSVTGPVAVLTEHAERIAGGELAWPIPAVGADEVGRLGASLEKMRGNLRELIDHVAEVNAQLEERVAARTKELNEANSRLREREEDRSQLLRKVITAQEVERKRIARELHDETTQGLAVLAMGVDAAQDALRSGKTPRLDEVKALAVRTLEDVHRLILDLRPSVLDDLGLLSAIRWYGERHLESRGIAVRCEFGEMPRLPPELETALFRICQETMSNVARHAQATAVLVQVGIEGDRIVVDIEDDGKGFEPGEAARREGRRPWGLMGIRERAEILGGTARIESAPGKGTHVEVRIPTPRSQQEPPSPPPNATSPRTGGEGGGEGQNDASPSPPPNATLPRTGGEGRGEGVREETKEPAA